MKQNRFTEMIAVIVCFLTVVPLVCATPTILWEDFDDGSGTGAFDPSFVHTFGPIPSNDTGIFNWEFYGGFPGNPCLMVDSGTQDFITFILEPGQYVSHASVLYAPFGGTISFIGQHGSEYFLELEDTYIDFGWLTTEVDMSTIGPIQGIVLSGGTFDDIRITVVPEPSTWLLLLVGMVAILSIRNHRVFKSIQPNNVGHDTTRRI